MAPGFGRASKVLGTFHGLAFFRVRVLFGLAATWRLPVGAAVVSSADMAVDDELERRREDCSHVKRLLFELFGLAVVMMLPFPDFHP